MSNTDMWRDWMTLLVNLGEEQNPRGYKCFALYDRQLKFDPNRPLIIDNNRKLSFKFAFAEAFWILAGDDKVETIAPYNKNIAQFSDDGVTYFGAYGPKIMAQLPYVINNLNRDPHSRQAVITIWREYPRPSKDIPCTVMVQFRVSPDGGKLYSHVVMRSSDVWLGLPYDVFNFSMLMHVVSQQLADRPKPTELTYTLMNGHIYERNIEAAVELLQKNLAAEWRPSDMDQPEVRFNGVQDIMQKLQEARDADSPLQHWLQAMARAQVVQ